MQIVLARRSLDETIARGAQDSEDAAAIMFALARLEQAVGNTVEFERLVNAARDIYAVVAPDSISMLRTTGALGEN